MSIIHSSHGEFTIDELGRVLEANIGPSWDAPIPTKFDVDKFKTMWGELEHEIDILSIGYWNPDNTYEPPIDE